MTEVKGYCVKCRKLQPLVDGKEVVKKVRGKTMRFLRGKCKVCGTNIAKMLPKK